MNKKMNDKMNLYMQAKNAYYSGNPIMEDFEFDALEKELGIENKSYIGTKHNPSYTIEHPFIMGSLSKIQIKEDNNGNIDWNSYWNQLLKYINDGDKVIITPKFDGCSFEINMNNHKIISISTRGDGEYGRDIKNHIYKKALDAIKNITLDGNIILRGEVLINKVTFQNKYSEFVNPRSFVAGILNRDIDWDEEGIEDILNDLDIVIYDVRIDEEGNWQDDDWTVFKKDLFTGFGYIDDKYLPDHFIEDEEIDGPVDFENIYKDFEKYRNECKYALDGIVIKPIMSLRYNNLVDIRPKDCVAIKFVPMLQETEIIDIEWSLGKTGELTPIIITNPVIMDGKTITRASAHNWGYCIDKGINIGAKVILSLAGDIIPFIYKVTLPSSNLELLDKTGYEKEQLEIHDCHLIVKLDEEEQIHQNFVNSALTLNIPYIGKAEAENIWNYETNFSNDETSDFFFEKEGIIVLPEHIFDISPDEMFEAIKYSTKTGSEVKAKKIKKAYMDVIKNISLKDIIKSCNFRFCGEEVAKQCANYMLGIDYSFEHLASKGYEWVKNDNSNEYKRIEKILETLSRSLNSFKETIIIEQKNQNNNAIPVILTGDPQHYTSKSDFKNKHPEYREVKTTKAGWSECKILFTNSLESTTSKMKKAKELGIEIKLY